MQIDAIHCFADGRYVEFVRGRKRRLYEPGRPGLVRWLADVASDCCRRGDFYVRVWPDGSWTIFRRREVAMKIDTIHCFEGGRYVEFVRGSVRRRYEPGLGLVCWLTDVLTAYCRTGDFYVRFWADGWTVIRKKEVGNAR